MAYVLGRGLDPAGSELPVPTKHTATSAWHLRDVEDYVHDISESLESYRLGLGRGPLGL
jgi:hypothetical protein